MVIFVKWTNYEKAIEYLPRNSTAPKALRDDIVAKLGEDGPSYATVKGLTKTRQGTLYRKTVRKARRGLQKSFSWLKCNGKRVDVMSTVSDPS